MIVTVDPQIMDLIKWAFVAGVFYAVARRGLKDLNGLGARQLAEIKRNEKRWKLEVADEIEKLQPNDDGKRLANRLRADVSL